MEVVEYDRDRAFGVLTHEGPVEIRGRAIFEPMAPDRARLTITADMQGMDDSMKSRITSNVEQASEPSRASSRRSFKVRDDDPKSSTGKKD